MGKFRDLPEEIVLDIFTRLPTESVLDCKLVCKPWRDVVRNPSFSQIHLNHLCSTDNFDKLSFIFRCLDDEEQLPEFYYGEYDENCHESPFNSRITRINLNLNLLLNNFSIVGSCNGLICFRYACDPVCICNPITREHVILPNCGGEYWYCGFGYVHSTNQYKVVRISPSSARSKFVAAVKVYTLGSGTGWRNLGEMDINWKNILVASGVFANGALHWTDGKGTIVLAFHLVDEKFSQLPAPPPYLTRDSVPYRDVRLVALGDLLTSTCYYDRYAGDFEIWLWKKNKENSDFSWVKEFGFVLSGCSKPWAFGFTKSDRLLLHDIGKIYSYDSKASSVMMDVSFGKFIYQAISHKNTLVSLKLLGEKDTKIMESGERPSSSEELLNKVRNRVVGFYAMGVKKFTVAIQKLHLPKC